MPLTPTQRANLVKNNNRNVKRVSGSRITKFNRHKFIAWDGEGLQLDTVQVYGLLANSEGFYKIDVKGISTVDCLESLLQYDKGYIHVCFGASYDVNMMLRDIPEILLRELHKGDCRIQWKEYELEYRPRKSFSVTKYKTHIRRGRKVRLFDEQKRKYVVESSMILWDVFGFFQRKFVSVLQEWTKGTEYENTYKEVIQDIIEGKQRRGQFTVEEVESFVLPYCLNECRGLRDIMMILWKYLDEAKLPLSRWDGAGAVAASLLKSRGIKKHLRTGPRLESDPTPYDVTIAAEFCYFGGWIESFLFGDIRWPVYHYDIRSAYPAATSHMPSLTNGVWKSYNFVKYLTLEEVMEIAKDFPSYWMAHIEWECPQNYIYEPGPFSWRSSEGFVTRPLRGRGWQYSPEIIACYEVCQDVRVTVNQIYAYFPDSQTSPFEFVNQMYVDRARFKKEGKGIEKVYKLGLNSIYGKFAQSLGYSQERKLKPPYHSVLLAGIITSEARSKVLRAARQKPGSIISIATDGIYSLEPLKLDEGEGLGQWEFTKHSSMTLVQSGFYWYTTDGKESHYYRGFNEGSITREEISQAYRKRDREVILVPTSRFVTLGAAIGLNDFRYWRTWRTVHRELDLWMRRSSKRMWLGEVSPLDESIYVTVNRSTARRKNIAYQEIDSNKYSFEWDDVGFDGQSARAIAEEMFTMELGGAE